MPNIIVMMHTGHSITEVFLDCWVAISNYRVNWKSRLLPETQAVHQSSFLHVSTSTNLIALLKHKQNGMAWVKYQGGVIYEVSNEKNRLLSQRIWKLHSNKIPVNRCAYEFCKSVVTCSTDNYLGPAELLKTSCKIHTPQTLPQVACKSSQMGLAFLLLMEQIIKLQCCRNAALTAKYQLSLLS